MYTDKGLNTLVGKKVKRIFMNADYLKFETDQGDFVFSVYGDCCSHSYFYDFYGVKNLLNNGKVTEVKRVELDPEDLKGEKEGDGYHDSIQVYGFQITTESENLGPVTSVLSFRNSSNGYYGGSLEGPEEGNREVLPEVTDDVIKAVNTESE